MNRLLILSDSLVIRSDEYFTIFCSGSAETSPRTRARLAVNRANAARLAERNLQTLRTAQLSLRRRSGTRAQVLFVHQPAGPTSLAGVCAQRNPAAGHRIHRQFSQAASNAGRDFRDQCGASAAAREFGLGGDGSGARGPRFRQGGSGPCGHGGVLSRRGRAGVKSGGAR